MNFRTSVLLFTVASIAIAVVSAQTTPVHKPAPKKAVTKKAAKKVAKRSPSQPRQSVPTPDRYKQIQQALAEKGYLKSEPNGVWDANSMDAMKRFQVDQKQDPSGKLTAASLIGLGLGPQTALMSTATPPAIASAPMP